MKKTLEELKETFRGVVGEDDREEVLGFLEDLTDSFDTNPPEPAEPDGRVEELEGKVSELEAKYADLKRRYRDRFYGRGEDDEEIKEEKTETDDKPDGDKIKIDDLFEERKD